VIVSKREYIERYLHNARLQQNTIEIAKSNLEVIVKDIGSSPEHLRPPNFSEVVKNYERIIEDNGKSIYEKLIEIYDELFTEEDMKIMADFFGTSTGSKLLDNVSVLKQQTDKVCVEWFNDIINGFNSQAKSMKGSGLTN
jgi:hypothetical protein